MPVGSSGSYMKASAVSRDTDQSTLLCVVKSGERRLS